MALSESEHHLLEQYLDGECDDAQAARVRAMISGREDGTAALRDAEWHRGQRSALFHQPGPDDEAAVDRILSALRREQLREQVTRPRRWMKWSGLAASVLLLGTFGGLVGYMGDGTPSAPAPIAPGSFTVRVTDDAGRTVQVLPASDYSEARDLADDLEAPADIYTPDGRQVIGTYNF